MTLYQPKVEKTRTKPFKNSIKWAKELVRSRCQTNNTSHCFSITSCRVLTSSPRNRKAATLANQAPRATTLAPRRFPVPSLACNLGKLSNSRQPQKQRPSTSKWCYISSPLSFNNLNITPSQFLQK